MHNIPKLYQTKNYYWLLYPSKDIAVVADASDHYDITVDAVVMNAAYYSDYWSKEFNCNVSYISPNSIFCLLEEDGKYLKILSTNGELG